MSARARHADALRRPLLAWYRRAGRDLPWRRTRDPYAIWLSETMLQQTRAGTVIPYYERFLDRFPSVEALANAPLDDVLTLWSGLGYYSRARNLHAAAKVVAERHAGRLPERADVLRELPGVGPYTAGAVASIAFDRPAPIVDGNVARVLARWLGLDAPLGRRELGARLWDEATRYVRGAAPGDANQALMELGATICTPRAPACDACPAARGCAARATGHPEALPVRAPRRAPTRVRGVAALVTRRGRVLAVRRPAGGLLGGLWELPGGELRGRERAALATARLVREHTGLEITALEPAGALEHAFTHRRLHLRVFRGAAAAGRVQRRAIAEHRWVSLAEFGTLAIGTLTRRALAVAAGDPSASSRRAGRGA